MQALFYQAGDAIDYTPDTAKSAGDVVQVAGILGVVSTDLAAGEKGSLHVNSVMDVVKVTGAIAQGAVVNWNATGDPVGGTAGSGAATAGAGVPMGFAVEAAGSSDTRVKVLLARPLNQLSTVIADPGNAGAIPVTSTGRVAIVTAGSETRTLAAPTFAGQELLLYVKTDGGTCVITASAAVNQTGNNTITMADVNDSIRLVGIENGGSLVWRVAHNDGAVLSTV
jgi:predicted RecA/RadA family phage recombinase